MVDVGNTLATNAETTLNIDPNVGRDTQMEIEETPRSSLFHFRPIKLSATKAMEIKYLVLLKFMTMPMKLGLTC